LTGAGYLETVQFKTGANPPVCRLCSYQRSGPLKLRLSLHFWGNACSFLFSVS